MFHVRPIHRRLKPIAVVLAAAAALAIAIPAQAATSWAVVTSTNPGTNSNVLRGVACPDSTDCWAVGYESSGSNPDQALIEHWNGTAWSTDTRGTQNLNNGSTLQSNLLYGISCISKSDCWAVGYFNSGTFEEPLWEHWDGTTWTASTFTVGVVSSYWLRGVSCVDANDCWAVGYKTTGSSTVVWIEQWKGVTFGWVNDPSTDPGVLLGVSCPDTTHCQAVGGYSGANLIEGWNGTAWSKVTSPDQGIGANTLYGVSCISTTSCWAAGYYQDVAHSGSDQNLLEVWNGTSWTIGSNLGATDNDSPAETTNDLQAVTCLSATYCWAVGYFFHNTTTTGAYETLIDQWNGTSWSLVPNTPNETSGTAVNDFLEGVACADTGHCAAVGETASPDPTLILMYLAAATPTPTPAPSVPVPTTGSAVAVSGAGGLVADALLAAGGVVVLVTGISVAARRRQPRR